MYKTHVNQYITGYYNAKRRLCVAGGRVVAHDDEIVEAGVQVGVRPQRLYLPIFLHLYLFMIIFYADIYFYIILMSPPAAAAALTKARIGPQRMDLPICLCYIYVCIIFKCYVHICV